MCMSANPSKGSLAVKLDFVGKEIKSVIESLHIMNNLPLPKVIYVASKHVEAVNVTTIAYTCSVMISYTL